MSYSDKHFKIHRRAANDICSDYSLTHPDDTEEAIVAMLEDFLSNGWMLVAFGDIVNSSPTCWIFRAVAKD